MREWLKGYKQHFIKHYFVNNPDYRFRAIHIIIALNFITLMLLFAVAS